MVDKIVDDIVTMVTRRVRDIRAEEHRQREVLRQTAEHLKDDLEQTTDAFEKERAAYEVTKGRGDDARQKLAEAKVKLHKKGNREKK